MLTKTGWATFWAIFFTNASGRPAFQRGISERGKLFQGDSIRKRFVPPLRLKIE
jgi:hypothetical protein